MTIPPSLKVKITSKIKNVFLEYLALQKRHHSRMMAQVMLHLTVVALLMHHRLSTSSITCMRMKRGLTCPDSLTMVVSSMCPYLSSKNQDIADCLGSSVIIEENKTVRNFYQKGKDEEDKRELTNPTKHY